MKDFFQKYKKIFQTPNAVCGVVQNTLTYIVPGSALVQSCDTHQTVSVAGSGYQRQAFHHLLLDAETKTKRSCRHLDRRGFTGHTF